LKYNKTFERQEIVEFNGKQMLSTLDHPKKIKLNFSGHETFPLRYTWLKKAVESVAKNPYILSDESAILELGVGKNMVTSIKHWGLATGVIEKENLPYGAKQSFKVTDFGNDLLLDSGWDPYLEDGASLWLLHWNICNNITKSATWYYAFNKLMHIEFTKEQLTNDLIQYASNMESKQSDSVIKRDVDCFVRTYISSKDLKKGPVEDSLDCPLVELSLLEELGQRGLYVFSRGYQKELPQEVFVYALINYWNKLHESNKTLSFENIAYGEFSPGLIFKIDEDSLCYRLEGLEKLTKGALRFDETSSVRQVYRIKNVEPKCFLERYFKKDKKI